MPQDYVIDEFRIDLDLDDPSTLFGPVSEECLEFQSDRDERYVELSTVYGRQFIGSKTLDPRRHRRWCCLCLKDENFWLEVSTSIDATVAGKD